MVLKSPVKRILKPKFGRLRTKVYDTTFASLKPGKTSYFTSSVYVFCFAL